MRSWPLIQCHWCRVARLKGTNLTGVLTDEDTIWPEGFDPVAAGVTFV
jgi:hypothetical protein